jgi:S1-C subfamily serine protease
LKRAARIATIDRMTQQIHNQTLAGLSSQMADAVATIGQSLVTVFGRDRQAATGIVYAPGLVLTADHVLERDDGITIGTADGNTHPARLAGRDGSTDLAILRVDGLTAPVAAVASSTRVGQIALAVARPSTEGVQASAGIISQIAGPVRMGRGAQLERYIRTDAIPYPGFSGGALTDANGAAYGLLTTGLARGAAVAIPMDIALRVAGTLTSHGYIKRGYLGIVTQQVAMPPAQRKHGSPEHALLVVKVEEGSPAEQGGVLIGDLLLSLHGKALSDADDLLGMLNGDTVGKALSLVVSRGGQPATLSVTVGQKSV